MDNQKVRAHLRKGELAVQLLEGMGFTYSTTGEPKWVAPASFVNMEEALKEVQAVVDKFAPKKIQAIGCPVSPGDTFTITQVPLNHILFPEYGGELRRIVFTVRSTRWVAKGSSEAVKLGYSGYTVTFDRYGREMWLPLSHIKVVTRNADF